jgi:hypothetical protein
VNLPIAYAPWRPSRFATAPHFTAYLGMVPSEHTSGPKRRIGAITKAGDVHARTLLIEAAHSYRFPARIARHKLAAVDAVPDAVREIAWKAQTRLCQHHRNMMAAGKLTQVVVTAIARELQASSGRLPASPRILRQRPRWQPPRWKRFAQVPRLAAPRASSRPPLKGATRRAGATDGLFGQTSAAAPVQGSITG